MPYILTVGVLDSIFCLFVCRMAMAEAWIPVEVGQVLAQTNCGQGDCLFVAISQQLDGEFSSVQLRQMAVEYLSGHRVEMGDDLLSLGWDMIESGEIPIPLEGDILIDAVLQTLSNPSTWGGAECLAALSMALNREIRVYQEEGPTIVFPDGANAALRIILRYPRNAGQRRTHYESVISWRPGPSTTSHAATSDASCQTEETATATSSTTCATSEVSLGLTLP